MAFLVLWFLAPRPQDSLWSGTAKASDGWQELGASGRVFGTIPVQVKGRNPISRLENVQVARSKWQRNDWEVGSSFTQKPPLLLGRGQRSITHSSTRDPSIVFLPGALKGQKQDMGMIRASAEELHSVSGGMCGVRGS